MDDKGSEAVVEDSNKREESIKNTVEYRLYQLLILVVIISCIPLVNIANNIIVGILLSSVILYFNMKLLEKKCSKTKIFINSFIAILIFYVAALFQKFVTYVYLIKQIGEYISFGSVDGSFLLIDIKVLLIWIPLAITSLIGFNMKSKKFKVYVIINAIIFTLITV